MEINPIVLNNPSLVQNLDIPQKQKTSFTSTLDDKKVSQTEEARINDLIKPLKEKEKSNQPAFFSTKDAEEIAENLNKMIEIVGSGKLEFQVHEATQRVMIMVVDKVTDEIVREIPPEQTLNASAKFREVLNLLGVLMDEKYRATN